MASREMDGEGIMALYKRGDTYWMDRKIEGHRYREPLGTEVYAEAVEREDEAGVPDEGDGLVVGNVLEPLSEGRAERLALFGGGFVDGGHLVYPREEGVFIKSRINK